MLVLAIKEKKKLHYWEHQLALIIKESFRSWLLEQLKFLHHKNWPRRFFFFFLRDARTYMSYMRLKKRTKYEIALCFLIDMKKQRLSSGLSKPMFFIPLRPKTITLIQIICSSINWSHSTTGKVQCFIIITTDRRFY